MTIMRPLLTRSWALFAYAVPTSFLLLFAVAYALSAASADTTAEAGRTSTVALGNLELIALVVLLSVLVLLSVGSAVEYWLDARKPEIFVRFLAGASQTSVVRLLLGVVAAINALGFAASSVIYVACRSALGFGLAPLSPTGIALALVASTILMLGATAAGVLAVSRRLNHVRAY